MSERKCAVILLAHGTPDELVDIPKYLSNVVSGRPMPQSVVDEITHRYGLIGKSPLTALTLEQGRLLEEVLGLRVYVGMRNWKPYIVDTVKQMKADGVTDAVAICLAPQNSRTSVGLYRRAVFAEAGDAIRIDFVEGWADHPKLAEAFAARLEPVVTQLTEETGAPAAVLFTAHSVPCRTIQVPVAGARPLAIGAEARPSAAPHSTAPAPSSSEAGAAPGEASSPAGGTARPVAPAAPERDPSEWLQSAAAVAPEPGRPASTPDPYPVEAKRTAAAVAALVPGLDSGRWYFAFQSQGMAGGPWIGPTVEDTLTALHEQGVRGVVLHTIGFLCDHVEILYDIDIAFREFAENLGMRLERPASLNDSPLLTAALVDLTSHGLARLGVVPAPAGAEVLVETPA